MEVFQSLKNSNLLKKIKKKRIDCKFIQKQTQKELKPYTRKKNGFEIH